MTWHRARPIGAEDSPAWLPSDALVCCAGDFSLGPSMTGAAGEDLCDPAIGPVPPWWMQCECGGPIRYISAPGWRCWACWVCGAAL